MSVCVNATSFNGAKIKTPGCAMAESLVGGKDSKAGYLGEHSMLGWRGCAVVVDYPFTLGISCCRVEWGDRSRLTRPRRYFLRFGVDLRDALNVLDVAERFAAQWFGGMGCWY